MAKNEVRVIHSDGKETRQPRWWARRSSKRGNGAFRADGVFVCHQHRKPAGERQTAPVTLGTTQPGTRAAFLIGQQWAQRYIPEFAADGRYLDPHGVLHFWADQSSHGRRVDSVRV